MSNWPIDGTALTFPATSVARTHRRMARDSAGAIGGKTWLQLKVPVTVRHWLYLVPGVVS